MKFILKNKFIFWNFIALVIIKTAFAYPAYQLTSIIAGMPVFGRSEIITLTNQFRQELGISPLKESQSLDIAAEQKLQDMIRNQYFAHYSPSGLSPWHWIDLNKYAYSYAGENLAIGFLDAKTTVNAWVNSPSHRKNLVNSNFQEIGVAILEAKINDIEGYVVVQMFGTPAPKTNTVVAGTSTKPSGLTFSLTGASAKESPTPKPATPTPKPTAIATPVATIQTTPIPAIVAQATVQPTKEPEVTPLLAVGTVNNEKAVSQNVVNMSPRVNSFARALNSTFVLYMLLVTLASVIYLMMAGSRRELIIKTAMNFAMLALSIIIPLLEVTRTALIL